ncbi:MAG: hypothetical protein MI807_17710 [Verrucomicrobiales bacterium]|nr:hypothetical protein [Verrucomicrobiales bacterium]
MKLLLTVCCLALFFSLSARAELRVPSSVFKMDELEEVKAKATADKEPLIFVYTDPGTT